MCTRRGLGFTLALCFFGCGSSFTQALAQYEAEQIMCVEDASTKTQADTCRASVKSKYCSDGGLLSGQCP